MASLDSNSINHCRQILLHILALLANLLAFIPPEIQKKQKLFNLLKNSLNSKAEIGQMFLTLFWLLYYSQIYGNQQQQVTFGCKFSAIWNLSSLLGLKQVPVFSQAPDPPTERQPPDIAPTPFLNFVLKVELWTGTGYDHGNYQIL